MRIDQIHEHLFISEIPFQEDIEDILAQGITAFVNLTVDNTYTLPSEVAFIHEGFGDNSYIPREKLEKIYTFIHSEIGEGRVLVHCNAGISRSGGICIGQIILEHPDWNWSVAEAFVRKARYVMVAPRIQRSILDYIYEKKRLKITEDKNVQSQ